jgi:hypothetical protein
MFQTKNILAVELCGEHVAVRHPTQIYYGNFRTTNINTHTHLTSVTILWTNARRNCSLYNIN